jgi:hypothetical protein
MRTRRYQLRRIPLFPLVPIIPAMMIGGTFVLSILSFARLRRLTHSLGVPLPVTPA